MTDRFDNYEFRRINIRVHQQYRLYEALNLLWNLLFHDYYMFKIQQTKKVIQPHRIFVFSWKFEDFTEFIFAIKDAFISFAKLDFAIKDASINLTDFNFAILGKNHEN